MTRPNLPLTNRRIDYFSPGPSWLPSFSCFDPNDMSIPITLNQFFWFDLVLPQGVPNEKKKRPKNQVPRRIFETSLEAPSRLPLKNFLPPFFVLSRLGIDVERSNRPREKKRHVFIGLQMCYWKMPTKYGQKPIGQQKKTWWPYVYFLAIERKSVFLKTSDFYSIFQKAPPQTTHQDFLTERTKKKKSKMHFWQMFVSALNPMFVHMTFFPWKCIK